MVEHTCGCNIDSLGPVIRWQWCPKHAAVDDLLAALEECAKHIVALTSLGPGEIDIDAARASAAAARDAIRLAKG